MSERADPTTYAWAARWGRPRSIGEAHRIAERIEAELRAPFGMGDREWFISASIGIALGLVLDEFGTGYSSLSYLKHLPLDTIKIDRTFVAGLDGETDRSIVDAVISLAHGLRIGTVAEGIETEGQFEQLRAMGCDLGQGYLFARPLPAVEAGRLLTGRRAGRATRAAPGASVTAATTAAVEVTRRRPKDAPGTDPGPGPKAISRLSPKAVA